MDYLVAWDGEFEAWIGFGVLEQGSGVRGYTECWDETAMGAEINLEHMHR